MINYDRDMDTNTFVVRQDMEKETHNSIILNKFQDLSEQLLNTSNKLKFTFVQFD